MDDYESLIPQKPAVDDYAALIPKAGKNEYEALIPTGMSEQDKLRQKYAGFTTAPTITESKQTKSPFKDLYEKPDNFNTIYNYAVSRFGKDVMQKGESQEDFVKRFATHMRMLGNEISATQEISYLNSAKPEEKAKAQAAYDLWKKTAGFTEKGGQEGAGPYFDFFKSIISSPTTLATAGTGTIAGRVLTKGVAEEGIKAIGGVLNAGGVAVEGIYAVGNVVDAGGVVEEGLITVGNVVVAGGVVEEGSYAVGSVAVAGGVAVEGLEAVGGV